MSSSRTILSFLLAVPFLAPSPLQAAEKLTQRQKELHVLNRLTFGPTEASLQDIRQKGIPKFIQEQLHPERIDDRECEKALEKYGLLTKTPDELMVIYPDPADPRRRPELKDHFKEGRSAEEGYRNLQKIADELSSAKLTRALMSRRQLQEVMVDFWFNHFNVHFQKNDVRWTLIEYETKAIRPHALGKFRDLLLATAQSPAMLSYLDNASNRADPKGGSDPGLKINENYARELLELHTVGVDGGYTQQDIIEAARILTGWSIQGVNSNSAPLPVRFKFKPYHHDPGEKTVMGHKFGPGGGVEEGVQLIDMLSRHPSTARFIARKLCQKFVRDDPPDALVARVAEAFQGSDGDIRGALEALFTSPEFLDPRHYQAKIKTPFEYAVSGLRVAGTQAHDWQEVIWDLRGMGEYLYHCEAPTGYADNAKIWLGSGSLLARIKFTNKLFERPYGGGLRTDMAKLAGNTGPDEGPKMLDNLIHHLLLDEVSDTTREALRKALEKPEISDVPLAGKVRGVDVKRLAGLVAASPEFQRQ